MSAVLPSEEWLDGRDEVAKDLVTRLVGLVGIERAGKILWDAYCVWKHVYKERDE